jgi:hypothetical protein
MLDETQCNINYLKDLQCVIAWSVFAFLCMLGESKSEIYAHHQFACVHLFRL